MSPIPGEPHRGKPLEIKTKDGKTVKLKVPGLAPPMKEKTAERGDEEPPRDDPRPAHNPNWGA